MAVYDNNGTTNSEIGKLYDHDGTASHQIGKVYDFDGTTDSLIYSAEQYLFNYGLVSGYGWTAGRNGTINSDNLRVWETATDFYSLVNTTDKVDLTGWSTLKGYALFNNSTYIGGHVGLGVNTSVSTRNWTRVDSIDSTASTADTYQTFTVDISSLSGSYYVIPYCYSANAGARFYKIWLE